MYERGEDALERGIPAVQEFLDSIGTLARELPEKSA